MVLDRAIRLWSGSGAYGGAYGPGYPGPGNQSYYGQNYYGQSYSGQPPYGQPYGPSLSSARLRLFLLQPAATASAAGLWPVA